MATAVATNKAAVSPLIGVLEDCWSAICGRNSSVALDTTIIVASRGRRGLDGHHAPSKWRVNETGNPAGEVLIAAEGLNRKATEVFATLLHEAVHSANFSEGTKDTSQNGRYHNERFASRASAMGLLVQKASTGGWESTGLTSVAVVRYRDQIQALLNALTLYRVNENGEYTSGPNKNLLKAVCECPADNSLRVSRRRLVKGIVCPMCGTYFKEVVGA